MVNVPKTRYAEGRGGRVAYQVIGDGPINVVVSHSGMWIPVDLMWDQPHAVSVLERMSSFCRHVWFDPRGRGASDPIPHDEDRFVGNTVDDIVAILDDLAWDQANFIEVNGPSATLFAATHPHRVSSLVLLNAAIGFNTAPDAQGLSPEAQRQILETIWEGWGTGVLALLFAPSLAADVAFRDWVGRCERLTSSRDEARWRFQAAMAADLLPALGAIQAPTLAVVRSDCFNAPLARYVAAHIDGAGLVEIPGRDIVLIAGDPGPALDAIEEFLTGERPQVEVDRVLATVLFIDIVASTERATELGDREWRQLLDRFRLTVREQLHRFRGREINTRGDDFLATFDGPGRALRCALEMTTAAATLGVEVRAGLHTGEVELMGEDVAGVAVHIGARVAALAGAGEVLVSRTVTDIVAGSGIEFDDRGEHELKGVPGTWRLFSVRA